MAVLGPLGGGVLEFALETEGRDEAGEADVDGACFGLGATGKQKGVVAIDEPADEAPVDAAVLATQVVHDHTVAEAGVHVPACTEADETGSGLQHSAQLVLPKHGQYVLRHACLPEKVLFSGTKGINVGVEGGHVDPHGPDVVPDPTHDLVVALVGVAALGEHEVPVDRRVGVQKPLKRDHEGGELDGVHGVVGCDKADRLRRSTYEDLELAESVVMPPTGAAL